MKGSNACNIEAEFKLFYQSVAKKKNAVGVVLRGDFARNIEEGKRVSDRVMCLKVKVVLMWTVVRD